MAYFIINIESKEETLRLTPQGDRGRCHSEVASATEESPPFFFFLFKACN